MSTTQPEALQLAQFFESMKKSSHRWHDGTPVHEKAAAELRRQHARIADLESQLASIGAGGVSPLMGAEGDAGTVASCDYKSMFGAAVSTIATISEALGIDEEEAACANGAELILEAIQRKNEALLAALQKFPVDSQFSPPSSAKGVAL